MNVSVPLRGLSQWKGLERLAIMFQFSVSVPLRGLSQWKVRRQKPMVRIRPRFSPLTGIKSVESLMFLMFCTLAISLFQSPYGD